MRRNITVADAEVDAEIERMSKRFSLPVAQWLKMLKEERGIEPEQYANDIIWPTLALRKLAGDRLHASYPLFPAAAATTTPAATVFATAVFVARCVRPLRLMLMTEGRVAFATTYSMPSMIPVIVPLPEHPSTRTLISVTPVATPYVSLPTVPATWVP